jgi:hypothetical protein
MMKKFAIALLALAAALAITPAALAGSLCPDTAEGFAFDAVGNSVGSIVTGSGPCGAVTMTIPDDNNDSAGLFWGSSSYGSTGLTLGNLVSFNTSAVFTGATGAQPYYALDFIDPTDGLGQTSGADLAAGGSAADHILLIESGTNNLSGGNMLLDSTTLFFLYDNWTGVALAGGESDTQTLSEWLTLYPFLSGDPTWVGVEIGEGGTGVSASLTVTGADFAATPEPSSLLLLGTGLLGLAVVAFRKAKPSGLVLHS